MVKRMKLNDICTKLVKNNKKQYKVILLCLIFGVALFTSLGIIVFSPMVKNGIVKGGTTSSIAYMTYISTGVGCLIFIMYSHSLFMKYKSNDIGVFISLGLRRKDVKKILLKEITYILPIGALIGVILGVPISYTFWKIMTSIIGINDIPFTLSLGGFIGALIFTMIIVLLIKFKTSRYINKVDIISIMKNEEIIESVKSGNYIIGIVGFVSLIVSLILYPLSAYGLIFRELSYIENVFAVIAIVSIYIIASQACSLGDLVKKININNYYKNIMFYNLLKLKGRQYTNTLFSVIILIGITVFMMCFSIVPAVSAEKIIEKRYPFDYMIRTTANQNNNISKEQIYDLANENNIDITEYNESEILMLAREQQFGNSISIIDAVCMSEDTYNNVYKDNIDVKTGYYNRYVVDKSQSKIKYTHNYKLKTVGDNLEKQLKMQEGIHRNLIEGDMNIIDDVFVLDNKDYNEFKAHSSKEAIENHLVFNVDNWMNSMNFYEDLATMIVKSNVDGIDLGHGIISRTYENEDTKVTKYEDMDAENYNNWKYKPFAKISGFTESRNENIYFLLFSYLGILSVISASVILYIKVLNTSWQDKKTYIKLTLLGGSKTFINSIITNQLRIIFFVPTIIGTMLGVYLSNMMNSNSLYAEIYIQYALLFGGMFCIAQIIMYLITRHILISKEGNFD